MNNPTACFGSCSRRKSIVILYHTAFSLSGLTASKFVRPGVLVRNVNGSLVEETEKARSGAVEYKEKHVYYVVI
jgi:hypothetical protein